MVEINPNASSLQARLQAQLQADRLAPREQPSEGNLRPSPRDVIDERIRARQTEVSDTRRAENRERVRNADLSSAAEIDRAQDQVLLAASSNRESPTGRTSERLNELRNQPLGQIVDIRV